jgi:F-type H+-transporting ATPase subunit delta
MATRATADAEPAVGSATSVLTALIRTAVPLDAGQRQLILERLSARYAQPLQAEFEVDPALLGGVWARVGDELIDDTTSCKLTALRDALIKSGETE